MAITACPSYEVTIESTKSPRVFAVTGKTVETAPLTPADCVELNAAMLATKASETRILVAQSKISLAVLKSQEAKLSEHQQQLPDNLTSLFKALDEDYHSLLEMEDSCNKIKTNSKHVSLKEIKTNTLDKNSAKTLKQAYETQQDKLMQIIAHINEANNIVKDYSAFLEIGSTSTAAITPTTPTKPAPEIPASTGPTT